jgi:hypothetical protein
MFFNNYIGTAVILGRYHKILERRRPIGKEKASTHDVQK